MIATSLYPQSPADLPKNFTALTSSYKLKASMAVLSIILFFLLYATLVVGLAWLFYYAIIYEMTVVNKLTIIAKLGAIAGSGMLFIFTLKFVFKLKNHQPINRIKLDKEEQSELWEFVNQICKETGAPRPRHIFIDPDVNAYVSYSNIWLSMFLPVKKDLTLGLGLISCLNMSEFKAVVSHEFGHFAQRSMKIGSFINSANTIIHDMIFSRDKWDDTLDTWRSADIRLSIAAWVITPIIWLIRQMLALFYKFLNIMHSSLSREMEFNADKVAVSTSGSEAIVSSLWRLDSGSESWNSTVNHAYLAGQKNIHVKNLYQHNQLALERKSPEIKELLNKLENDNRGGKLYFTGSELSKVSMYASHPPNDLREDNAKSPFVECATDTRSPWLLFNNASVLQEEMTALIYEQYLGKNPETFIVAEKFENFIAEETKGAGLLKEYHNAFENRFMNIDSKEELVKNNPQTITKERLQELKSILKELMQPVKDLEANMQTMSAMAQGTSKLKEVTFNDVTYNKKNLEEGYNELFTAREKLLQESFKDWDRDFLQFHLTLAEQNGLFGKLMKHYNQHRAITELYKKIANIKSEILTKLSQLQQQSEVEQSIINAFCTEIILHMQALNEELEKLKEIDFVAMPNIENRQELLEAVIESGKFTPESGQLFENGGFDRNMQQIESALNHCQRIEQKSIGNILLFHSELQKNLN